MSQLRVVLARFQNQHGDKKMEGMVSITTEWTIGKKSHPTKQLSYDLHVSLFRTLTSFYHLHLSRLHVFNPFSTH